MTKDLPAWALRPATPQDRLDARRYHRRGNLQIKWPKYKVIRGWAGEHGWPASWWSFEDKFIARMLESDENFELALQESGIEVALPRKHHTISDKELRALDEAYADGSWAWLVEALREIRRAVQAGVAVTVEGTTLKSFQGFYDWAHGRYYGLEDDTNTGWIGSDEPSPGYG